MTKCIAQHDYNFLSDRCSDSGMWLETSGYCYSHTPKCDNCGDSADVYAMDKISGGWAGRYCLSHKPNGYVITDRYNKEET